MADAAVLVATAASIFGPLALVFALAVRDYAAMSTLYSPPGSLPCGLIVPRIVGAREYSARLVAAHGRAARHPAIAGVIRPSGGRALRRAGTITRSARNVGLGSRAHDSIVAAHRSFTPSCGRTWEPLSPELSAMSGR
jgi:hypothetical protein